MDARLFDLTLWGGILVVCSYLMGTLYERNERNLREVRTGYEGILVILRQFLGNQTRSESRALPYLGLCDADCQSCLGSIPKAPTILRTATLLQNLE